MCMARGREERQEFNFFSCSVYVLGVNVCRKKTRVARAYRIRTRFVVSEYSSEEKQHSTVHLE